MHLQELAVAAVFVLCAMLLKQLHDEIKSPFRSIPGPMLARITCLWYFRTVSQGNAHKEIMRLHYLHAPEGTWYALIIRLGPNMFSISSPEKVVYGVSSKMPKSSWYEGWKHPSPERWTLFTEQNIPKHNQTRKKFQAMYSLSSLLHYEPYVDMVQDVFAASLRSLADSGSTGTDVHHWLQCYAFDVIGSITFGQRFGILDKGEDVHGCMRSLDASMVYSTLVGIFHRLHPVLFSILQRLPKSGAAGRSFLMSMVTGKVADREVASATRDKISESSKEDASESPRDFLDIVLDAEKRGERGMTRYNVFMMAMSNVIAGSDTTAVSLSSILWHLAANPGLSRP
jgi:cytochrome P450